MEIRHRIAVNRMLDKDLFDYIIKNIPNFRIIPLPGNPNSLIYLDISEQNPKWEEISILSKKNPPSDIYNTYFTNEEILSCEWVRLCMTTEKSFNYRKGSNWRSNNFKGFCNKCGTFDGQSKPLIIFRKGKLGRDLQVLFGTNEIITFPLRIEELSKKGFSGFEGWPIYLEKENELIPDIQQLFIRTSPLIGSLHVQNNLKSEYCNQCNIIKYYPHMHGWMTVKKGAFDGMPDIFHTYEFFGAGGLAFKEIIISKRLAEFLIQNKWKGFHLKGVKTV